MIGNSDKDLLDEQAERIAALEAENVRLQQAKRMAGLIADERSRENVALRAIVDELRTMEVVQKRDAEIERLRAALEPFAHCVHNDNGEITVTTSDVKLFDYFRAYRALRPHEQGAPTTVNDTDRLSWLQKQIVDTIYLDDGRIIDVRGNCVRAAIDKAVADKRGGS